MHAGCEPLV